jgi:asparagine synthase (glutamine-hydrolysing)
VNLDGLREIFAFIKTPGHAVWEGMREVEPGTVMTVGANGIHEQVYCMRWPCSTTPRKSWRTPHTVF